MSEFRTQEPSWLSAAFLAALTFFTLFFRLGGGSLASWDEAIYASVAKAMLQSGDWIRLRFAGSDWFDKPPLAMWATAFFYKLFGVSEFSSRLFSALCGAGTVAVVYRMGCRFWGRWAGFCSAICLLTSGFFIGTARFATLDSPLTFFLCLAFYFFWLGLEAPWRLLWSGAALGLAFMTKSFAVAPFLLAIALFIALCPAARTLSKKYAAGGLLIAALIALPWHWLQWAEFREAFWRDVIVKHLMSRTSHAVEGHQGGPLFYFRTLLNKFRPAIFLGVLAIPWFIWKALRSRTPEMMFLLCWLAAFFLSATFVQTKLAWYIFPALPALALMVGYALSLLCGPRWLPGLLVLSLLAVGYHGFHARRFEQDYSRPIRALADRVRGSVPPNDTVYLIRYHEDPAATFYWGRRCMDLDDEKAIAAALERGSFHALIRSEDYPAWQYLFDRHGVKILFQTDSFYWLSTVV